MGKKIPVVLDVRRGSTGLTNEDIVIPIEAPGQLLCVQRVCFEDEDNACTEARFGAKRGSGLIWIESVELPTAGALYSLVDPLWLPGEYQLVVRFTGSTTGDDLYVLVLGYVTDVMEG